MSKILIGVFIGIAAMIALRAIQGNKGGKLPDLPNTTPATRTEQ